ncbi:MAG: helix-turn-helix domain-containing protein, partial [Clostridia bacterium]|nr:helix-turn-helix domain-containing protein [Clostridia bacterium]
YHIHRPCAHVTVLEYVLEGEGELQVNDRQYTAVAGTVYILPKGAYQDYRSSAENPWKKIFINLLGDLPLELLNTFGLSEQILFSGEGLLPLFERVRAIVENGENREENASELAGIFFQVLTRLQASSAKKKHSPEAVQLRAYLDAHPARLVGNEELARSIYRSPDYCVKLFRREFGTTPYDYQIGSKLRMAKHMLRDTNLPIARIAGAVGYEDPRYFSGLFKKKIGVSPRAYRKGIN